MHKAHALISDIILSLWSVTFDADIYVTFSSAVNRTVMYVRQSIYSNNISITHPLQLQYTGASFNQCSGHSHQYHKTLQASRS